MRLINLIVFYKFSKSLEACSLPFKLTFWFFFSFLSSKSGIYQLFTHEQTRKEILWGQRPDDTAAGPILSVNALGSCHIGIVGSPHGDCVCSCISTQLWDNCDHVEVQTDKKGWTQEGPTDLLFIDVAISLSALPQPLPQPWSFAFSTSEMALSLESRIH